MDKRGMTLVEIIVAMAIVGIITTVVTNVFIFGNRSFRRSNNASDKQMDVRLAAQAISKELRYAEEIELLEENINYEYGYKYVYFNDMNKKIMKKDGNNNAYELLKADQIFSNAKFLVEDDGLLKFSVISKDISKENNYEIKSAISLLNQNKELSKHEGAKVIRYKTQDMEMTYKNSEEDSEFWKKFMDAYEKDKILTAHGKNMEKRYYTRTGKDGEEIKQLESIVIAGDEQANGGMIFRDMEEYVDDPNNYTITIDAHTQNKGGGWGVLINGHITGKGNKVKDNGYMLQFDPGANGIVIRQIYGGHHLAIADVGITERSDGREHTFNNSYFPSDFTNDKFKMEDLAFVNRGVKSNEDSYFSPSWTNQRYKTEINVKIDPTKGMLLDVTLIDGEGNRSNTVKFGDFGSYTLNQGKDSEVTVKGNPLDWKYKEWKSVRNSLPGTYIGLRSWNGRGISDEHETKFYGIDIRSGEK